MAETLPCLFFTIGVITELVHAAGRQRRSSRPPNPPIGEGPRSTLGAQVSLKLLFGYVTIFSSADLFTTDLNCRKKLACSSYYDITPKPVYNRLAATFWPLLIASWLSHEVVTIVYVNHCTAIKAGYQFTW